ncbi:hypothetical protein DH2020_026627 [Rehmannia glutinosa]|uniref:Uncharacterized protein n=1 Tax=Rehmannia glutinosa TaxID=99300 RepID=A0ABR0VXB6_REHGL
MEEIWTEGDKGQSFSKSLLQVFFCSYLSSQKEGSKKYRRSINCSCNIRRRAQPFSPLKARANSTSNRSMTLGNVSCSTTLSSSGPTITLDLTKPNPSPQETRSLRGKTEAPEMQHYFVEQMASQLTKDPSFKAAIAAAISGKFVQQNNQTEKW